MTPGVLLMGLSGAITATGIALVIASRRAPAPVPVPPARWRAPLARWRISPRSALIALAAGAVVLAVTGWPVAGIAAVPAVIAIPRILSRRSSRARVAKLEALESWTRRLADVLAASRGLEDALTHSAASAAAPIAGPVAELAAALRLRTSTSQALRAFADAIDDPVGDLIASALLLAAERRGPGVHAVLTELAGDVAADVAAQREVEAERATYRTTLVWIVGFLIAYTGYLMLERSYSAPFATPAGQVMLALVVLLYGLALWWLHRLAAPPSKTLFLNTRRPR